MITLVALSFFDEFRPLDAFAVAIRVLGETSAVDAPGAADDVFPPPPFRRDFLPPILPRNSRRFRFTDDPDERRN